MKDDIVIVSAARTPVGAFNGAFANLPAHELGKAAIKAALDRAGVESARVSEVIMGQILTAGQGQNPARQASISAGIPVESPAWGVNQLCGSGLRAVALGYQAIANGDSDIVVAGGQESMSMAPHCQHLRRVNWSVLPRPTGRGLMKFRGKRQLYNAVITGLVPVIPLS